MNVEKIKLRDEVELLDGKKTKILELREPVRADLAAVHRVAKTDIAREDAMIIRLSSISQESLDNLPLCDNNKVVSILEKMGAFDYDPKN
ncbi:phage tail assembly protein [Francisella philomiragia]|uniref:phage tail assembly protein n=1 Tax=Francisella philomiragia TaxID=28110 RepID=UPI001C9E10C0|nr:phage tail assembly protein [Francisella philomiragia]MBY7733499.1 phage tail assembly protein [Francisella philomiragia]